MRSSYTSSSYATSLALSPGALSSCAPLLLLRVTSTRLLSASGSRDFSLARRSSNNVSPTWSQRLWVKVFILALAFSDPKLSRACHLLVTASHLGCSCCCWLLISSQALSKSIAPSLSLSSSLFLFCPDSSLRPTSASSTPTISLRHAPTFSVSWALLCDTPGSDTGRCAGSLPDTSSGFCSVTRSARASSKVRRCCFASSEADRWVCACGANIGEGGRGGATRSSSSGAQIGPVHGWQ
mmetsp:Transcript_25892/g.57330  ORF Transcript_25892/g.57330 Transcript_25892/m.57330 type:complete len:239 (-) Transcript_25892:2-718(-)